MQFLTPSLGDQGAKVAIAPGRFAQLLRPFVTFFYYEITRYSFFSHSITLLSIFLRDVDTFLPLFVFYTWYVDPEYSRDYSHILDIGSHHLTPPACYPSSRGRSYTSLWRWDADLLLDHLHCFTIVSATLGFIFLFIPKRVSMFLSESSEFPLLYQCFL